MDRSGSAGSPRSSQQTLSAVQRNNNAGRFHVLVMSSGGKFWRRNQGYDGKRKGMAFGVCPRVSLAEARAIRNAIAEEF